jgi:diguanylate cyclase (GGDEF)-like protein/putative nucleotidyltransferase with HDIG domain
MTKDRINILVADNDPPVLHRLKAALAKDEDLDYAVESFQSSKVAMQKASAQSHDLLLINQELPDGSGVAVLQEVMKRKMGIPVIIIVAEGDEKIGVKAMDQGAYDYLTRKEIKTDALRRAIRRAMLRKKLENEIRESITKLERLAIKDGLTGLYNKRHFREVLKNEYKKTKRHLQPLACIMVDLDYFKSVNDNHGHQFGDFVLMESSRILRRLVRDTDFVARYGGEEFIAILPNTDRNGAYILAERIRSTFSENVFKKGDTDKTVTVSIGVSSSYDENVISDEDLIENADKALYSAKAKGRNLVCSFENKHIEETVVSREASKKVKDFNSRMKDFSDNLKENCIESAHTILREVEKGLDYINDHANRVSRYVEKLTRELQMSEEDVSTVKRAALLHDVGMVGIRSKVLRKKGSLTSREYSLVKKHTNIGVKLMEKTRLFEKELPIILYHHERFDGSGYPHKLQGDNIPFGARILAVAEAYDVMVSENSYRKQLTTDDAVAELKECAGTQFDPGIVKAFVKIIEKEKE